MQRRFKITVDGRAYDVTVEEVADRPSTIMPGPGDMSAAIASDVTAAPSAPASAAPPAAEPGDEVSELAGVVDAIHVTIGQAVKEGDKVATIEAMKMKTAVTARRTGKVTVIHVAVGNGVEPGQPLLTIG
ncbi:MAG: biotin/lipoyl-containing protein [Alphaproteobacteria bacterium]